MEKIYEVFEITSKIKKILESNYSFLQVQGELSGVNHSSAGHLYFRLKDSQSQISCVFFRFTPENFDFVKDGEKVIVTGRISVYEPQGNYQLILEKISPLGIGELQIQFEKLKKKLQAKGYFDSTNKKKISLFSKKIGIVTSLQAAALQDILKILKRRAPQIEVLIAHSLVQGDNAAQKLIAAITVLEKKKDIDFIVITRGGGSMEDLWCFNDEKLAEKIFACQKPIVSAVGHESDFTICDLVADKRAATPSEAAEMLSNNNIDLLEKIQSLENSLKQTASTKLSLAQQTIQTLHFQLGNPLHKIQNYSQKLDDIFARQEQSLKFKISENTARVNKIKIALEQTSFITRLLFFKQEVNQKKENIKNLFLNLWKSKEKNLLTLHAELQLYNPTRMFAQGYARILNKEGKIIKKIKQVKIGQPLKVEFQDGIALTSVQQIIEKLSDNQ